MKSFMKLFAAVLAILLLTPTTFSHIQQLPTFTVLWAQPATFADFWGFRDMHQEHLVVESPVAPKDVRIFDSAGSSIDLHVTTSSPLPYGRWMVWTEHKFVSWGTSGSGRVIALGGPCRGKEVRFQ